MANIQRGEVDIRIGGRTRVLRFDLNALSAVSHHFGITQMTDFVDQVRDMSPERLRFALWAGLQHADKKLKIETVGAWDFPYLPAQTAVVEAVLLAFNGGQAVEPDDEEEESSGDTPL